MKSDIKYFAASAMLRRSWRALAHRKASRKQFMAADPGFTMLVGKPADRSTRPMSCAVCGWHLHATNASSVPFPGSPRHP